MGAKPVRAVAKDQGSPGLPSEGLLLITDKFDAVAVDPGATLILSRGQGASKMQISVPGEVRKVLSAVKEGEIPNIKARFRVSNALYNCRVFLLQNVGEGAEHLLALHIQRESSIVDTIHVLAADYNLSDREQEALEAIAAGLSSKQAAERMHISPNTVKSFIRTVMLKMGVGSRAAMIGRLLEYTKSNGHPEGEWQGTRRTTRGQSWANVPDEE